MEAFARGFLHGGSAWRLLRPPERTSYNRDYHAETVFVRRGDRIQHFYNTELLYAPHPEGQDGRHVDSIWPLWNVFDLSPAGRGTDWYPRLTY